jgi:hypothetical protein
VEGLTGAPTLSRLISELPPSVTKLRVGTREGASDAQLACLFRALQGGALPRLAELKVWGTFGYQATAAVLDLLESGALSETLTTLTLASGVPEAWAVVRALSRCPRLTTLSMEPADTANTEPFLLLMDHITSGRLASYRAPPIHHLNTAWTPEGMDQALSMVSHAVSLGHFQDMRSLSWCATGDFRLTDAGALSLWQSLPRLSNLRVGGLMWTDHIRVPRLMTPPACIPTRSASTSRPHRSRLPPPPPWSPTSLRWRRGSASD